MKRIFLLGLTCLAAVTLLAIVPRLGPAAENSNYNVSLQSPQFVQRAFAEGNTELTAIGDQLAAEAGMTAYYQTPSAIDLNLVRGQYRTIETETANYIIGSVAVPGRPEQFDVHVYVHVDGWILAYYMNDEPASKIIEPSLKTIDSTKFTTVISALAGAAGQPFSGETYYDFRYPNATNLLLVAEDENNGNDFIITPPSAYGYSERSWAAYDTVDEVDFNVDNVNLWDSATWTSDTLAYGSIAASQLLPDTQHTFSVEDNGDDVYAVLVITYRVP